MAAKPNPLIAAVLKQIPDASSTRAQRLNWLRMVAMSMDTVYGTAEGGPLDVPDFLPSAFQMRAEAIDDFKAGQSFLAPAAAPPTPPKPRPVRLVEPPRYFIDHAGIARHAPSMDPINPEQVGGELLFDDRGEFGDLGSIRWADGRRGVLGLQLNISASPAAIRA